MRKDLKKIGFIGLGVMGANMAENLGKAGYQTCLYDIDKDRTETAAAAIPNGSAFESPRAVAEESEVIITMLPNGRVVKEVIFSADGLYEGYQSGAVHLDTSSAEPWITIEVAEKLKKLNVGMVDAPVSGAEEGAISGDLVFMVGGEDEAVSRVKPLLDVMGNQSIHLGPVGSGHRMKSINNIITAMCFMATAEGLIVGKRHGLDPAKMIDVINVSTGMSWNSINHFHQRIFSRTFDDAFKLELMVKDIGIAMELANEKKLKIPLSEKGHLLWKLAEEECLPESSISEMVKWVEEKNDIQLTTSDE